MNSQDFQKLDLPDAPGVYFFKGPKAETAPLYIGRATSLRDRVKSYFAKDLIATRGQLLVDMVARAESIEWQVTDSVLEAIILENNLIKANWPTYNTKDKDNRSYNYVIITDEEFPRVCLVRGREFERNNLVKSRYGEFKIKKKFGPYPQAGLLNEALIIVRRIFPFRYAKGGKSPSPHHEAFYRSLGLSPDTSTPEAQKEYAKTIRNVSLFFQGRKKDLVKTLEKEMKAYAKTREFEKAAMVKKTLYALNHIQDVALVKTGQGSYMSIPGRVAAADGADVGADFRIEAYDIAHLSGKEVVGVMVVIESREGNYEPNKNEYRKFKLSKNVNDDTGNLKEILTRRLNHPEWKKPDLIVIDGGQNQINAAQAVIEANDIYADVPIVSVLKDSRHKAKEILTNENATTKALSSTHSKAIFLANAEAHRFAIAYHRYRRRRATGI
jgi:excinuclease UvrABC nuclease subunit